MTSTVPRGCLVVCATPIGNLEDVTLRVLRELAEADLVLCEDTRRTRLLLERHGIRARLESYHRHNEARRTERVLPRLRAGENVALVSDAGLPAVSDPGGRLIGVALEAGVPVTVLPGPTAAATALVASGFPVDRYQFVGYLPRGERALDALWRRLEAWPDAVVAYESPRRLPTALSTLALAMPARPVAVCRELTKAFEEVVRGTAADVATRFAEPPKGEITLVLGGWEAVRDDEAALDAVAELTRAGVPRRQAAALVARLTGVPKNRLYDSTL